MPRPRRRRAPAREVDPTVALGARRGRVTPAPELGPSAGARPLGRQDRRRRVLVEDARVVRHAQRAVEHDARRRGARHHPHRQLRIVGEHGADADQHGVAGRPQRVRHRALRLAADPAGVAGAVAIRPSSVCAYFSTTAGRSSRGRSVDRAGRARRRPRRPAGRAAHPPAGRGPSGSSWWPGSRVAVVRRGGQRDDLVDRRRPPPAGRCALAGCSSAGGPSARRARQHRGRVAVVARVGRQAEQVVRVDRVGARRPARRRRAACSPGRCRGPRGRSRR